MNYSSTWPSYRGIAILIIGILVGFIVCGPNVMLSDSGRYWSLIAANCGLVASILFMVGGLVGFFANVGWWILLPGLIFQLLALIIFHEKFPCQKPSKVSNEVNNGNYI